MAKSFYKAIRSQESLDLLKHPYEYTLLSLIAYRARRYADIKTDDIEIGEAMVGDYKTMGLTRQQYRTALKNLEKWNFLTTKPTNKGTIVKLINTDVFDINIEEANQQTNQTLTNDQPTTNHQLTTNNKDNKEKKEKKDNNLPDWINKESFAGFVEMRNRIKKPLTDRARQMLITELKTFKDDGYDPNLLLDKSTMNCWQGVFKPKEEYSAKTPEQIRKEKRQAEIEDYIEIRK